jgi:YegS/Rv2252/BmrU family lipid kinase
MTHSVTIIYNPMAGPLDLDDLTQSVRHYWQSRGWTASLVATKRQGDGVRLARLAAEEGCQLVVSVGGDGTVGQVAQGLAHSSTVLAVVPAGTANTFAKLLNLAPLVQGSESEFTAVLDQLVHGRVQTIDLGRLMNRGGPSEGSYFISWTGTGINSSVVDQVEPRPKWVKQVAGHRLGWLSYILVGIPTAMRFPGVEARVLVDNQKVTGTFVMVLVANTRLFGGGLVQLSPEGYLDDGRLDVWLFRGKMFRETVGHVARLLTQRHLLDASTIHLRGRRVLVETWNGTEVELDGEPAGHTPLYASIAPLSLRLLAPVEAPSNLFSKPGIPFSDLDKTL